MAQPQLLFVAALVSGLGGNPDASSNAGLLCMLMDNTRSVAPCVVSEARHNVTINIRLKGKPADQVCRQIQAALAAQRVFFDGAKWRLDITTSSNRGTVAASCDLPQTQK